MSILFYHICHIFHILDIYFRIYKIYCLSCLKNLIFIPYCAKITADEVIYKMLIDFHVHTFPDAIAEKTLAYLLGKMRDTYKVNQKINYGGTPALLLESMEKTGVDISATMPIATKPSQYASINKFAKEITCGKIISFGTIHPQDTDIEYKVSELLDMGFKGIKLHPDYQDTNADSDEFIHLVKYATEKGMYVTIHSGHDIGIVAPFKSDLSRIRRMLDKVDDSFVILAHMGAFNQWDEVEKYIINSKAYFDLSVISRFIDIDQYRRIIENHGPDRILFGSDMPWESPADTLKFLKTSGISGEDFELITHKNAQRILGLEKN